MLQTKIMPDETQVDKSISQSPFFKCLINNMIPILANIMSNQFGNYLCQKIIEISDSQTLSIIVNSLQQSIVDVSLNIHGTRVVQSLIEKLAKMIIAEGRQSLNHFTLMNMIQGLNAEVV